MVFIEINGRWIATEKIERDKAIFKDYLSSLLDNFFQEQGLYKEGDVWVHQQKNIVCKIILF